MESLKYDYVFLATPAIGINDLGSADKLKKILEIARNHGVVNVGDPVIGSLLGGSSFEQIQRNLKDGGRVRGIFSNRESLVNFLREVKKQDLGVSITVSGLIKEVLEIAKEVNLKPHTINLSLGIWGRKELLPDEKILELTTMCGHHLISQTLVKNNINDFENRQITLDEAIKTMAKPCVCGIFNPARARELVRNHSTRALANDQFT